MNAATIRNVMLILLTAACLLQLGAQLFAISVLVSTIAAAPPRSLAILHADYPYDSSAFWEVMPSVTTVLFIVALIANWKTPRRRLVLAAFVFFFVSGAMSVLMLEPGLAGISAAGFHDSVDAALQAEAQRLYMLDWISWVVGLVAGFLLLAALALHPLGSRQASRPAQIED